MSTFDDERRMQPFMDSWYQRRGLSIDRSVSCMQYDCRLANGTNAFTVEEKFNFQGREYDQLIVELIQAMESGKLGWFYHVQCDRLMWLYCPQTRRDPPIAIYSIEWYPFKTYVIELLNHSCWQKFNIVVEGYGITLNFPVKWQPLFDRGIVRRYEYDL